METALSEMPERRNHSVKRENARNADKTWFAAL